MMTEFVEGIAAADRAVASVRTLMCLRSSLSKILKVAMLLLLANAACGASVDIYIDSAASAGGNGSIDSPYNTLSSVNWATVGQSIAAGNTVYLDLKRDSVFNAQFTVGMSGTPTAQIVIRDYGTGAKPKINGGAYSYTIYAVGRTNITFQNLDLTGGASSCVRMTSCDSFTFIGCTNHDTPYFYFIDNSPNIRSFGCSFVRCTALNYAFQVSGANSSYAFYYCLFNDWRFTTLGFSSTGGTGGSFVNCTFTGIKNYYIFNSSSAATIGITNCVFSGSAIGGGDGTALISSSAGTCITDHCMVLYNGAITGDKLRTSGVTEYFPIWGEPGYTHTRYPCIFTFGMDDGATFPEWVQYADLMRTNYNWRSYISPDRPFIYGPMYSNEMQRVVVEGHEICAHSRYHDFATEPRAITIQYVGPADTCTMDITNGYLQTMTNGVVDLSLNLSNTAAWKPGSGEFILASTIDGNVNYTCKMVSQFNNGVPPYYLTNTVAADIKTAPYVVINNMTSLWTEEVFGCLADLMTVVNGGTNNIGWRPTTYVYPDGAITPEYTSIITNGGFNFARTVNAPFRNTGYIYDQLNSGLLRMQVGVWHDPSGQVCHLQFNGSVNDYSAGGHSWNQSGLTWSSTPPGPRPGMTTARNAVFDGSSAYIYHDNFGKDFDFSSGDWLIEVYLAPAQLSDVQTIYYHGTDANNWFRIDIDASGAVWVRGMAGGVSVVNLHTPAGTVTAGGGTWQNLCCWQTFDEWGVRMNHNNVTYKTNSTGRLPAFTGTHYGGCGYDFVAGVRTNFYNGKMCNLAFVNREWAYMMAALDRSCEGGMIFNVYNHGAGQCTLETARRAFDAIQAYSGGPVIVTTLAGAYQWMLTNGASLMADGLTLTNHSGVPLADYSLRSTSVLTSAGSASAISGTPNLSDLAGTAITDGAGNVLVNDVSVGAYQYAPNRLELEIAGRGGDLDLSVNASLGLPVQIQASGNLVDWLAVTNVTGMGTNMDVLHMRVINQDSKFFRAVVP